MAVETKAPPRAAQTSDTLRIEFLFLDLTTCSRCLGADRSLGSARDIVTEPPGGTPEPESYVLPESVESACCSSSEQESCCEFSAKADCCGAGTGEGCGCR
jgi:hypothetical protein